MTETTIDQRLLDKNWRMSHLYRIRTKREGLQQFSPNRMQDDFAPNATNRNIILKSRQLGMTTFACIDMLDGCLFSRNYEGLIIAHQKDETNKLFDTKIDFAWKNLPDQIRNMWTLETSNVNTMRFGFGMRSDGTKDPSISSMSVATSGRSGTYSRVHISEFGKICRRYPEKAEEIITGTFPAVPTTGRIDIESTAEGEDGYFASMFWTAWNRQGGRNYRKGDEKRDAEFSAFFYNWQWDDEDIQGQVTFDDLPLEFKEYQEKYKLTDQEISYYYSKWIGFGGDNAAWRKMKQEYPTTPEEAFSQSGDKMFPSDKLNFNILTGKRDRDFTIFHEYKEGHRYALGADVSEGVGGDSSTCVVWDFHTDVLHPKPRVAATYASKKISPDMFAYVIKDLGNRYGTCLVAPERNNHGLTTITILRGIYPVGKIFSQSYEDKITKTVSDKLGWHTNMATKPKMFFDFSTAVEQELLDIPSSELVHEMKFYDKSGLMTIKSDPNMTSHFDLLTAAVIGWQMRSKVSYKLPPAALGFGGAGWE